MKFLALKKRSNVWTHHQSSSNCAPQDLSLGLVILILLTKLALFKWYDKRKGQNLILPKNSTEHFRNYSMKTVNIHQK